VVDDQARQRDEREEDEERWRLAYERDHGPGRL
jgi:hypothetical protein